MVDEKITDLTALTGANLADSDVFEVTDISDTTMDASGTSKKITRAELMLSLPAFLPGYGFISGKHYLTAGQGWTNSATANGTMEGGYFPVPVTTTFDRIGIKVWTAGSSGSLIRLGIWRVDATGTPSSLVLDAGTIDSFAGGTALATISQTLTPGLYMLSQAAQGAPATNPQPMKWNTTSDVILRPNPQAIGDLVSTAGNGMVATATGITGALPSTWPSPSFTVGNVPRITLRAA